MLHVNERKVAYYDTFSTMHPPAGKFRPITYYLNSFCNFITAGDAVQMYSHDSAAMRVSDYSYTDDDILVLLIQYSDTNVSDPVFSDLDTGVLRVEPKLEGEGVALSCHCAMDMRPLNSTKQSHLTLIEQVPGVPRWRIEAFLNRQLKSAARVINEKAKNENGRNVLLRPQIELFGHLSDDFVDSIKKGYAKDIELVRFDVKTEGFDEETYLSPKSGSLKFEVTGELSGSTAVDQLSTLIGKAREKNYDTVRIKVRKEEGDRTVSFGTGVTDIEEAAYTKIELIKCNSTLNQCEHSVRTEMATAMSDLIRSERE